MRAKVCLLISTSCFYSLIHKNLSTARQILNNTFFQILGKIITAGLSIIVVKIITNYLGVSGYGQYTTIYEFLAFFGIAADLGIYTIAVREMSRKQNNIAHVIGNVLFLRTILAFGLMFIAALTAFFIPQYQGSVIPMGIAIASISTFFSLLSGTISSVLQVHLKMQYSVFALVISKLFSVGYMLAVIFYFFTNTSPAGFYQLLWAGVFGNFILLILTWVFTQKFTKIRYRFDPVFVKEITIKALPYGIALILNTLYFRMDTILLSLMKNSDEVGIYGVAMRMLDVLVIIPVYFMNSVLPVMTRYFEEKSQKIIPLLQYSFDFLTIISVPIVIGMVILSRPIINLVSSPEFLSGYSFQYGADIALQILIFALFFSFLNSLFGFTLVALGKQKKLLWINLGCVIFNLISNLIVIPTYGFRGAAFTSVLSEFFILITTFWAVRKLLNLKLQFKNTFKIIFAGTIMGIVIFLINQHTLQFGLKNLLILIPVGGIVYASLLYSTKIITPEILKLIKGKTE